MNLRRLMGCGVALAAWLSATGALGTCDFFKPAVPEAPSRAPIIPDYSSPTATLQTLAKGIVDKNGSNGQAVYMQAFAESTTDERDYHAFFDLKDLLAHTSWDPNRDDWGRAREAVLYNYVVSRPNPLEMSWEAYEPAGNESGTPDRDSLLHRKYKLVEVLGSARVPVAIGAADLYFVKSPAAGNHWVIARWQDYYTVDADPNQITLGSLRLERQ